MPEFEYYSNSCRQIAGECTKDQDCELHMGDCSLDDFEPTTLRELMNEAGSIPLGASFCATFDIQIRVASDTGEHGILSIYKSDCGKYIWLDIEKLR